ncbi:sugar phosphate isomerase/epimerase family protein [Evansella tamaricis]|uniref:Sugar phosphate isomerase/epimerase n=1 Tax=Evansella tamaricis TaxID=2069301 RepID=A0ABS6JD64_9BACI|nr:sugar phosphate isomerase/epimerase [Evansella tamaricis]MBU9711619.1 sugar phosphate isomerase/epimerase [Evansella tamaricis]
MNVGILAHLFGKMPYKQLAEEVGSSGFKHVQLALWKAVNDYDFSKPGLLNPGLASNIKEEFNKHGVSISILACYLHLYHRDKAILQENTARFKELIRYASLLGAPIVAAEVGKPTWEVNDEDWKTLIATIREIVEEGEKWGVFVGIEPANGHLIDTATSLKKMLDEINSSQLGVVLDPGNLLTAENFYQQEDVIEEAFRLLGNRIVACHAKDRILTENSIKTVPPGKGQMNYSLYLKLLEKYKPESIIIMEAAKSHEMAECKRFLESVL